jgi:hypothetical protein
VSRLATSGRPGTSNRAARLRKPVRTQPTSALWRRVIGDECFAGTSLVCVDQQRITPTPSLDDSGLERERRRTLLGEHVADPTTTCLSRGSAPPRSSSGGGACPSRRPGRTLTKHHNAALEQRRAALRDDAGIGDRDHAVGLVELHLRAILDDREGTPELMQVLQRADDVVEQFDAVPGDVDGGHDANLSRIASALAQGRPRSRRNSPS